LQDLTGQVTRSPGVYIATTEQNMIYRGEWNDPNTGQSTTVSKASLVLFLWLSICCIFRLRSNCYVSHTSSMMIGRQFLGYVSRLYSNQCLNRQHSSSTMRLGSGTSSDIQMSFLSLGFQMMLGRQVLPLHSSVHFAQMGMSWTISNKIPMLTDLDWSIIFSWVFSVVSSL